MKIGEIRYNKFGTPMRIVDFTRHDDVTIEFLDLHNMKKKLLIVILKMEELKTLMIELLEVLGILVKVNI